MASETWSAILSGWPSVTDSEVNKKRSLNVKLLPLQGIQFGRSATRTGSRWVTEGGEQKDFSGIGPTLAQDTPAPSGLRLGMHLSIVIAAGGHRQRVAANGQYMVPKGGLSLLNRDSGFA